MGGEVRGLRALGKAPRSTPAPVDFDELVSEVADLVSPRAEHAGVRLESGPPSGGTLVGHRDAVRAALVNLAVNGIDAAGRGGRVLVRAEDDEGGVRLVVEDTGPGPPAALAASIHEPFVTGKPEGIGLGLAVVKAVAEQHGGRLAWSRAEGRTRFEIALPSTRMKGPSAPPAESS